MTYGTRAPKLAPLGAGEGKGSCHCGDYPLTFVSPCTSHQHSSHVNAAYADVCHQLIHGEQSYPAGIAWHTSNSSTNKAGRPRLQAAKLSLPRRLTACRPFKFHHCVNWGRQSSKVPCLPQNRVSFFPKCRALGERYDDVRSYCLACGQQVLPACISLMPAE